jgi:outer membrane protein TolC
MSFLKSKTKLILMLVFHRCLTVSTGVLFYLSLGTPSYAQESFSLNKSQDDLTGATVADSAIAQTPVTDYQITSQLSSEKPLTDQIMAEYLVRSPDDHSDQAIKPELELKEIDLKIVAFPPKPAKNRQDEPIITVQAQTQEEHSKVAKNEPNEPIITVQAQTQGEQFQYSVPREGTTTELFSPSSETSPTNIEPPIPQTSASELSKTEKLDPSPNPLLFPTKKDEVKIDNVQAITLEEAIELGRRNTRDLQVAQFNLEKSREQLREAMASIYPNLSTQFNFSHVDSAAAELQGRRVDGGQTTSELDTKSTTYDGRVEMSYDVYTGGRRGAQIRAARESIKLQELELERLFEQNRFNVTRRYYALQNADAQIAIQQAAVEDATQSLRDAELLEQAGLGTKFDVLRSQVELANANQNLTLAVSNQRVARRELVELLSLGQHIEVTAAEAIEIAGAWDLSLEESIVMAYRNRAELEQNLVQRNINEEQQTISISTIKPQISVFANYNFLGNLFDDLRPADGYQFGARLSWQFFDGGAARARKEQSKLDVKIDETQFADQRNKIRLEVETAYYNLQANQENIGTASIAVQLAEESLRLARLRFQAGVGTQTDVINSQTELTIARGNLLRAIIDYNQSLNALQRSVSNLPDQKLFDLP